MFKPQERLQSQRLNWAMCCLPIFQTSWEDFEVFPSLYNNVSQKLQSVPLISRVAMSVPQFFFQAPCTPFLILNSSLYHQWALMCFMRMVSGMAITAMRTITLHFPSLDSADGGKNNNKKKNECKACMLVSFIHVASGARTTNLCGRYVCSKTFIHSKWFPW